MARLGALAALLALAAGSASGQRDNDAVSLLQSSAQGALQPAQARRYVHGDEDIEDTRFQTFVKGEVAELRSQRFEAFGGWIACNIIGPSKEPNTYDVVIPGTAVMKGIPALMLRKKRKASATPPPERALTVTSAPVASFNMRIDGDPGENVEILVRKGPKVGTWVPGRIFGDGTVPDSFDITVFTKDGTPRVIKDVPGLQLRKAIGMTTPPPSANITYRIGERVEIKKDYKDHFSKDNWVQATISAPGKSSDTFTVYVNDIGYIPEVPKRVMRKLEEQDLPVALSTRPKDEDLVDTAFQVGEDVEVKVLKGTIIAGMWLKARVAELGRVPFTYLVNITQWKLEEITLYPACQELLRRPNQKFSRAAMSVYEIGEAVEFKTFDEEDTWFNATIHARGEAQDCFDIVTPAGQNYSCYPVEMIRKVWFDPTLIPQTANMEYRDGDIVEYKNFLTGFWNNGSIIGATKELKGTYEVDAGEYSNGTVLHMMPPELLRRPATAFAHGDIVEVEGKKGNDTIWSRCVVKGSGSKPDTYNIHHQDLGLIRSVPFKKLRKATCTVPPKYMLSAYEVGEKVDTKILYGAGAGEWVRGRIASKGSIQYTFNLTIPGMGLSPNVPIELLRKVPASRFKIGEFVRAKSVVGPLAGTWQIGLVSAVGKIPDTYNITFWRAGLVPDYPIELMRKRNHFERPEDTPVYEVGDSVKVRIIVGFRQGEWLSGQVKKRMMPENTTAGPRYQLYTVGFPELPDLGDVKDVPVELLLRDDVAARPLSYYADLAINDTVQLRGMIGPAGAPWVKVYIHKNGTKRDTYDILLPGVGIYPNQPVELLRHPGSKSQVSHYQAGQFVEIKDTFDLGEKLWSKVKVVGPGRRPDTYDCIIDGTKILIESVPMELMRSADGQDTKHFEKIYHPGEVVEAKDHLGVIAPNCTTKIVFRIVDYGELEHTYNVRGPHIGILRDIPVVLLKKVKAEELSLDEAIEVGDYVQCLDVDKPGSRILCYIDSAGERPNTWNVRVHGYTGLFPNIPAERLYKRAVPLVGMMNNITVTPPPAVAKKIREMKVGDTVEVYDSKAKFEDLAWLEAVIIGEGTKKKTWDVKIGEYRVFRNVPRDKLRFKEGTEQEEEEETTTPAPEATEEPWSVGDVMRYKAPGVVENDTDTWMYAMITGEGKVPGTYNIGLKSGFQLSNIPVTHLVRDRRLMMTTQPPEVQSTFSVIGLIMPTIKTFQEMMKKKEQEKITIAEGDAKAAFVKENAGKYIGDGSVVYEVGEKAEVLATQGQYKGIWVQCVITGLGKSANSYDIHLPDASGELRDIPDVGAKALRKIGLLNDPEAERIRSASPCTEDERLGALQLISEGGLFRDNPEECKKVMGLTGVNNAAVDQCAQKKFSVSAQCSQCVVNFGQELGGGSSLFKSSCAQKCLPAMQACSATSMEDLKSCATALTDCMACAKVPIGGLLKCIGAADSTTMSKLDQVSEVTASGQPLTPNVMEGIYGSTWVSRHRDLLAAFLGSLSGGSTPPPLEQQRADKDLPVFEANDKAELRIQKGPWAGTWIECEIKGKGRLPNSYNVHIPNSPQGQQDFVDVSALILRRIDDTPEDTGGSTPGIATGEDPL